MPWPDFSELSFGFAFLREFERYYTNGGHFPLAPSFITAAQEAKSGYDVKVVNGGTPVFFQFKRSYVLKTRAAKEIKSGDFNNPIVYRMSLQRKDEFRQHKALQKLARLHRDVYYVTSQVPDPCALNRAFVNDNVIDRATAIFSPLNIGLPNFTEKHHVSFKADAGYGFVYSENGERFERKYNSARNAFSERSDTEFMTSSDSLGLLYKLEASLRKIFNETGIRVPMPSDVENVAERVSLLAYLGLDAHLQFLNMSYEQDD